MQFEYTPTPTEIYPLDPDNTAPHWVVTATEFQINSYDFHLWDSNPHCYWDTVTWSFADPIDWVLEPFGDRGTNCKVYVLDQVADTVWLEAHAHNRCAPLEGITQRYWLVCSFYGVEENGPSTGSGTLSVMPNPNNGQMTLDFEHLTGHVDLKVYDMRGVQVDHVQTFNSSDRNSMQYDMQGRPDGIYLFVMSGREGTVVQKVIINR